MRTIAPIRPALLIALPAVIATTACAQKQTRREGTRAGSVIVDSSSGDVALDEMGTDDRGIPRYTRRQFSADERRLLRDAFGVDEPNALYLSDSSDAALVKFDPNTKRCRTCYVDSYRLGFLSLRQPGETWRAFEQRVRAMNALSYPMSARSADASLGHLDPEAQRAFASLIEDAHRQGFRLRIKETYRSPAREAMLFSLGKGRTYTATSMHSYGHAVDFVVGDGNLGRPATKAEWIRFRRFVLSRADQGFRVIGTADHTWDWPHVELASPSLGFHSIEAALRFASRCTTDSARAHAPSPSRLGGAAGDPCVFPLHFQPGTLP